MNITVLGAGRVGLISAVCYVQFGHQVTLVDTDLEKLNQIRAGNPPFLEEGLTQLLSKSISSGALHLAQVLTESEAFILCLPTPSHTNGETDLSSIEQAFASIQLIELPALIIVRSTVPPLAIRHVFANYFGLNKPPLVLNPEFLREGSAIVDFFHPPFCIAGGDDPVAVQHTLSLYEHLPCPKYAVSLETAALLKYACNAFHALKIAFANEIGQLAFWMQADGNELMRILASDTKLNASSAYLKPGFAFGGPCLGKDLSSLLHVAHELGVMLPLLENILPSNEMRIKSCVEAIMQKGVNRVGLIGVSFKQGTGDVRNSPYLELAKLLEAQNLCVKYYDSEVPQFAGSNKLKEILDSSDLIALGACLLSPSDQRQVADSQLPILNLQQMDLV